MTHSYLTWLPFDVWSVSDCLNPSTGKPNKDGLQWQVIRIFFIHIFILIFLHICISIFYIHVCINQFERWTTMAGNSHFFHTHIYIDFFYTFAFPFSTFMFVSTNSKHGLPWLVFCFFPYLCVHWFFWYSHWFFLTFIFFFPNFDFHINRFAWSILILILISMLTCFCIRAKHAYLHISMYPYADARIDRKNPPPPGGFPIY